MRLGFLEKWDFGSDWKTLEVIIIVSYFALTEPMNKVGFHDFGFLGVVEILRISLRLQ